MSDFWSVINDFKLRLEREERINQLTQHHLDPGSLANLREQNLTAAGVVKKIEAVAGEVVAAIARNEPPAFTYDSRNTWQNVRFQEGLGLELVPNANRTSVKFDSIQSVNKFAMTLKLLSVIHQLIQTNAYCTKRDLYYQNPQLFSSQSYIDDIVDNISCMLRVPRWQLHVLATSKGLVAGDLQFTDADGMYVDCSQTKTGLLVPNQVQGITNLYSSAKVVLVIEKDASFQKLLDDGVTNKLAPCIIITGKGFPDMNTRQLVKKLWEIFQLPTMVLVDADPHGIEIMCVYKYGSRSLSFECANLAVPAVRWLGVLPSDIERLQIPAEVLLPLTTADKDKANDLLKRPYMASQWTWRKELETVLQSNKKAEIQCLSAISPHFLTDVYLPSKLRHGGWI